MPKTVQMIKEFDGGLNTFSGSRDIGENECSSIQGFKVRKIGELLPLGGFVAANDGTEIDVITATQGEGSNPVVFDNGAEIYTFSTDFTRGGVQASEKWLMFVDKDDGRVYIHAKTSSPLVWELLSASLSSVDGLPGRIATGNMTAYDNRDASMYAVDGAVRICDPNYNNATFISDDGSSSLWFGFVKRDYLSSNLNVNSWWTAPAKIQKPTVGSGANFNFLGTIQYSTANTGPNCEVGQFGLNFNIQRNKGDGTLFFKGRKFYVTYTYDGTQESLPTPIATVQETNLPAAPTNNSLGYEHQTTAIVENGAENIPLDVDVRNQTEPLKNWDNEGTITVLDTLNNTQTLSYTSIVDGHSDFGNAGDSTLAGVTGWVDNGSCSINYVVDSLMITSSGSGYTGTPTVTISAPNSGTTATASAIVSGESIIDLKIVNPGDGYESAPIVTISGGNGSGATAQASISGELSTEALCINNAGSGGSAPYATWTGSNIASGATVTFDAPGELEARDENLGCLVNLTCHTNSGTEILADAEGGNRITAVNLYSNKYQDDLATIPEVEDLAHFCSFDLVSGFKKSDGSYNGWVQDSVNTDQYTAQTNFIGSLASENYQSRTGLFPDTISTETRWLDAVVVNRRVYAGNVFCKDQTGSFKAFPDKILKSLPNQFDTFPLYDSLDVTVDDGDDITGLETWGGKLLQFKREAMYLIDITSQPEFLAATFKYRGIPNKAAKTKTDNGIAFANANGVFLFNGETIDRLSQGKIELDWQAFYAESIQLGFDPKNGLLIITKGGTAEFFVYDITGKSWTKGAGNRHDDGNKSRMFSYDGELYQGVKSDTNTVPFFKYTDTYVSGTMGNNSGNDQWTSREIDFGNPAGDTFVYNVKLSYKANSSTNAIIEFIGNDGTGDTTYATDYSSTVLPTTSNENNTIEIKATSGVVKCKTFKIKISEKNSVTLEPTFVITDMTIVYRDKRIK